MQDHDLDTARAGVAAAGLVAEASAHLTGDVAMRLPFEALGPFKNLLKTFFSPAPWTEADDDALSALVAPHLSEGEEFVHDLGAGFTMTHGKQEGRYRLRVDGASAASGPSLFDRAFAGPVVPEPTPHPRKVKFGIGGRPGPGRWHRRDDDVDDARAAAMLEDPEVTDVMVAGDFVTIGLRRAASWETRLEEILARVTDLFYDPAAEPGTAPTRTRDELVAGARTGDAAELHLLDPDQPEHRERLEQAAVDHDPRVRRVAVATLAQSRDRAYAADAVRAGYGDVSRLVRRVAVDAAADAADERLRPLLERALGDEDPWIRWKAVRGLRDVGVAPSRDAVALLADDDDFQVRFEVAAALRTP